MEAACDQFSHLPPARPAGAFRVLHTADWHLGKTLGDLDRSEEHAAFLDALFKLIVTHEVDLLLVAGDVFDSAHPPQSAVGLYFDFLTRVFLHTQCYVVITAGNHDSPSHIDAPRQILHAVRARVVGAMPAEAAQVLIPLPSAESPRVVIAAIPFLRDRDLRSGQIGQSAEEIQRALRDGLKDIYARVAAAAESWERRGVPIIALGHLTVLGATTSDSERDIHVGGLGSVGADVFPATFDYVALGHLHRPQEVGNAGHVRYSGSPLPLSFSESTDCKEVRLLEITGGRLAWNQGIALPVARSLVQLQISYADLEKGLLAFSPPPSVLEPWLEITVQNAPVDPSLADKVRKLLEGRRCRVLRVLTLRDNEAAALSLGDEGSDLEAQDLLGNPAAVFAHRLDQEPALDDQARSRLQTAFTELHNLLQERERDVLPPQEVQP